MTHYGRVCACCHETQLEFLAIDHINGNGQKDRIEKCGYRTRGGVDFYRALKRLNYPLGYRVLCHNCNMAISHYKKCPHAA